MKWKFYLSRGLLSYSFKLIVHEEYLITDCNKVIEIYLPMILMKVMSIKVLEKDPFVFIKEAFNFRHDTK